MRITVAPDICIVMAEKDDAIEYWAAATVREKAVAAVEKQLLPGMDRNLTRRSPKGGRDAGRDYYDAVGSGSDGLGVLPSSTNRHLIQFSPKSQFAFKKANQEAPARAACKGGYKSRALS